LLGANLAKADAIVISHEYYDHMAGLSSILKIAFTARIYMHPAAMEQKLRQKPNGIRMIGMSDSTKKVL